MAGLSFLVVIAGEVGGRWSDETKSFLWCLVSAKVAAVTGRVFGSARAAWCRRGTCMLVVRQFLTLFVVLYKLQGVLAVSKLFSVQKTLFVSHETQRSFEFSSTTPSTCVATRAFSFVFHQQTSRTGQHSATNFVVRSEVRAQHTRVSPPILEEFSWHTRFRARGALGPHFFWGFLLCCS